jgi:zinc protease
MAQVLEDRSSPGALADDLVEQLLYGDHPYAHPLDGDEDSLEAIGRIDVLAFAAEHLHPAATTLLVAGGICWSSWSATPPACGPSWKRSVRSR